VAAMIGAVIACWRYPVKSMQGMCVEFLDMRHDYIVGDRAWGLIDVETGKLASAKRFATLLMAAADDESIRLPDGRSFPLDSPDADALLSAYLDRPVRLVRPARHERQVYEMTFDPPNDDAELVNIPTPVGTFLDWAPVHLVMTSTLDWCKQQRPDLDWDIRRFRPNIVIDYDGPPFVENDWASTRFSIGEAILTVRQPTVRCAMPLRAQPGLDRQPAMFQAMSTLNIAFPNHIGIYLDVTQPSVINIGDPLVIHPGPPSVAN